MARSVIFWWSALGVFLLDRVTKLLVLEYVPFNSSLLFGFFSLTYVTNTGTLFGLFKSASWLFAFFAVVVIVYLAFKHSLFRFDQQFFLGLVAGGAAGNLFDRLLYGHVIDFIDFHFWPVFNIADSAVCIAVVALLVLEYRLNKRKI